ncbi:MAG: TolC family protein [Candidatus Omnitrophota bacterium]|nr:TolC family protein [Candidatus Omnitrophota bacterium]MBA3066394.1 TolC family protein [bacterium]MBU2529028.1 TolC family protein [bacterium]MBU3930211.1 TolC family protein [bacterium]MBU4123232.1 TolC family protein [bacterium]
MKKIIKLLFAAAVIQGGIVYADTKNRVVGIDEFIKTAVSKDTSFEEILIDEMTLQYKKDLGLPARDIVLSVKSQYEFFLDHDESGPAATIGLSKLFPFSGTDVSAQYKTVPSATPGADSSAVTLLISQPVAKNAFGKATRLQDKIIGAEIDVIRHQVAEAYEDYLARIITAYFNWYLAYENLKIGESSYRQNLELLDNIRKRRKNNIALPIDVNKINIQVLVKKENLLKLREKYDAALTFIKQALRHDENESLVPADPMAYDDRKISFEEDYRDFTQNSRTYSILTLLEDKSSLQVARDANALLPSTNLLLGYETAGNGTGINNAEDEVFAGISLTWPFPDQTNSAALELSKINEKKTRLSGANKYIQLRTDLKTLILQIETGRELIAIADEKIKLAKSILKDETENYSYGKVSLNDFIEASNRVDENRFSKILRSVELKSLMTEWFRLTDRLISEKDIKSYKKK